MDYKIVILASIILIMLVWENLSPKRKYPKKLKFNSYITDIFLSTFNNIITYLISIGSLYYFAENISSIKILSNLDYSNPLIFIGIIIFLDFNIYFWHYLNHRFDALWLFHKVHHSEKYLNTLTGIRFHIGELIGSVIYKSALLIFILGIPINIIFISETIILISALFHHSNIRFKFERMFGKIFIMPYMHEVHHSTLKREHDSNYGVLFSFWDRIFGTFKDLKIKNIGLEGIKFKNVIETIRYGFTK